MTTLLRLRDRGRVDRFAGAALQFGAYDLSGSTPAGRLIAGERDVLLADNRAMTARLAAAGCDVDLRVYPEAPHGFTGHPTGMARAALNDRTPGSPQPRRTRRLGFPAMYFTDRGIEELVERRGEESVTLEWVGERLRDFVDQNPEFETPLERFAVYLARLDDEDDE